MSVMGWVGVIALVSLGYWFVAAVCRDYKDKDV